MATRTRSSQTRKTGSTHTSMRSTELSQNSRSLSEILDCPFRLSASILNPAPNGRFKKRIGFSHYEQYDVAPVRETIPSAHPEVVEPFGKAITRRRKFFTYRQPDNEATAHGRGGTPASHYATATKFLDPESRTAIEKKVSEIAGNNC